jgi:hypothetical protein
MKAKDRERLLEPLKTRFEQNPHRHRGVEWTDVRARLEGNPVVLKSLHEMESTGGEPDLIGWSGQAGQYTFFDCSAESPVGRGSVCYDREALASPKEAKPRNSADELAIAMGIELLTEAQYRELQSHGEFDTETSSWIRTPPEVTDLGGALFCDRRYGKVFVYHNGAQSYYATRGFRGSLLV